MRLPVKPIAPLAALAFLYGCASGGSGSGTEALPVARNGPAADYPMLIGDAFTIGDVTYTPADRLNYDAVGYASAGSEGGESVSAAHKTLPLPSYAEVTALDSGKTVLVRLERRGPMTNDQLIELSPGAAAQLGLAGMEKAPVRVRRVNPPEPERALLRSGQRAPDRMDTPKPLLAALLRKLELPAPVAAAVPSPQPEPSPAAVASPPPAVSLFVQAGAFASRKRADAVAAKIGAEVQSSGRLFRVRMGPFLSRADAEAALAKARTAGYSDARIQRAD